MKRLTIIPTLILIGIMLACLPTKAEIYSPLNSSQTENIPLTSEHTSADPDSPRAPMLIPISCYFDVVSGNLSFVFAFPMGDVTITLTEASAGVVSTGDYSSSSSFISVPVPGSGTYTISLILESGEEYTGQFAY